MNRRQLVIGTVGLVTARGAAAQDRREPTVAIIILGQASSQSGLHRTAPAALAELGWVDGRNVRIEVHAAEGRLADLRSVVAEAVRRKPAVIMAGGGTVTADAMAATREVPIVMSASAFDPVEQGWTHSYSRPGGKPDRPVLRSR